MGTFIGHVAPGFAFSLLGLWHLFNHIKLHAKYPSLYSSSPWFPTTKVRYIELYFIIIGTSISIIMELFIGPKSHQPFDSDGTIPSNHLHNFEHASISISFFVYAIFAILLDKIIPKCHKSLTQLIASMAFSQQFLLFHLHSSDHIGIEGQYHLILQLVICISLITTLAGISFPKSFLISFVRSISIVFQGIWLIFMGYMLWTPKFIPKNCFINLEEGHQVVRCHNEESLHRAKSLANIEFSWFLVLVTILGLTFYLTLVKIYGENVDYSTLANEEDKQEEEDLDDIESQQRANKLDESKSFIEMGKIFGPINMER